MTWVLGSTTPFGYAALISDTRVTWPDGQHADILQKIHPVANNVIVGFAGSVHFGFWAINDMRRVIVADLHLPAKQSRIALWRWRRRARYVFQIAPDDVRRPGAQLILAHAIPTKEGVVLQCVTMASPDFVPVVVPGPKWTSIGSGAASQRAVELAEEPLLGESQFAMMQGEVMNPGGYAMTVGQVVAHGLFQEPVTGVSDLLQVGIVTAGGSTIHGLGATYNVGDPHETARHTPRDLCTSWAMFKERVRDMGAEARAAVASAAYPNLPGC